MFFKTKNYISHHKIEIAILLLILIVAAFFRLYKISDYMTFLGDEGRDAIVAKNIVAGKLTLLGPRASAGDFFLGPIYYYMMAPFLFLAHFDPVGPAIMVAIFGIATVFLVYYVGLKFFNARAGLIASSLYAISPLVIAYSRSSWNPNPMPFFSILMLYVLFVAVKKQSQKLFLLVGLLLGISMQLHYLSTFLAVIIFLFILFGEPILEKKLVGPRYVRHYLSVFIGFLVGISPFLAFEIRHGFPNIRTIFRFIFEDNASNGYNIHQSFLGNLGDVFFRLFGRLVTKFPPPEQINVGLHLDLLILEIATIVLAVSSIFALFYVKEKLKVLLLALWLLVGIFLFAFYKKSIYDYYLGFLFPVPFLLVGGLLNHLFEIKKYSRLGKGIAVITLISLVAVNLSGAPFRYTANKQKDQAKNIADSVLAQTNGKPFNFALLTRGNSDHVYRYFFEIENRTPVTLQNLAIDPQRKSATDQLMVVCEYADCQPLGNSLWEVAGFGRAEITGSWHVPFVTIYRLIHYDRPDDYSLKKVLTSGTREYANVPMGISFQYPDSFILEDKSKVGLAKNVNLNLSIHSPEVSSDKRQNNEFNVADYDNNSMEIQLQVFENLKDITLEEFLSSYFSTPEGNSKTSSFSNIKSGLTVSKIPKENSYSYQSLGGEKIRKSYFATSQHRIYFFTLFENNPRAVIYAKEKENIFDNIVKSVQFK